MAVKSKVAIEKNVTYEADWSYFFTINRWILLAAASWPCETAKGRLLSRFCNVIQGMIMTVFIFLSILYIWHGEAEFDIKIKCCIMYYILTCYIIRYFILAARVKSLRKCIHHLQLDWKYMTVNSKEVMLSKAKTARYLIYISVSTILFTFLLYQFAAVATSVVVINNVTHHNLPYPQYYIFFDATTEPYYYYIHFIQFVSVLVMCIAMCISIISVSFQFHICGQLDILIAIVQNVTAPESISEVDIQLKYVVNKYCKLMRLMYRLEYTWCWIFFFDWLICLTGVCFSAYYLINEPLTLSVIMKSFFTCLTGLYPFSIPCYCGELIIQQTLNLGMAAYKCQWYSLPKKSVYTLIMILRFSQNPYNFTAGKIIPLCVGTISEVLKTGLAFFNVIKSLV